MPGSVAFGFRDRQQFRKKVEKAEGLDSVRRVFQDPRENA